MLKLTYLSSSLLLAALPALAQTPAPASTYTVRLLTPETALKAVSAALADCRKRGYQVAVAVVDRAGVTQALLRDRFAGAHTPDTAVGKAWTAVSFRTDTLALAQQTQPGQPSAGVRHLPRVVAVGGGELIEAGGNLLGAIGVSGAPGGDADAACARAGIAAIRDEIDF
ncbi:MAG TPA: heme-binding protein [Burkholderiaceae bacterium]|nr:heme-binding protein [Burkholderiaceae bacterium]